jgi:hypothetical protein
MCRGRKIVRFCEPIDKQMRFFQLLWALSLTFFLSACGGSSGFSPVITGVKVQSIQYGQTATIYLGRNAAGESFLRGFLTHSQSTEFWAQVQNMEHAKHFAQTVQSFARTEPVKAVDKNSMPALAEVGMPH